MISGFDARSSHRIAYVVATGRSGSSDHFCGVERLFIFSSKIHNMLVELQPQPEADDTPCYCACAREPSSGQPIMQCLHSLTARLL
jgi:hypothetical protein